MTDTANNPGAELRALQEREGCFVIPNPWDVGSARILAAMGFKALATTSAGMAFALGLPEGGVSRDDTLEHCREIVGATPLPVSADLEKGFGDSPRSVSESVLAAAETGLAGCSIEDHSGREDDPIFEFELALDRITAAAEASRSLSRDFVLTARAENFLWGRRNLGDTIRRLQAFAEAGADVLYAPGLPDLDSIHKVCEIGKPVNVVMGLPGARFTVEELAAAGVKRISVGAVLARTAYGAFVKAAREITGEGSFNFADTAIGFAEMNAFFEPAD
ncbi:MAG: isocitrate lyase/phosphoenolpyruvate mutase family protein [Gammaproteobacteria bacterium]|nr:isocitrate lyase/phosphoenolpyruvate mutase family protein [Gammaproteobacteria bacterium]